MIKLGIIGLSPGNGHPYSWSAIFNGYNTSKMEDCGYPSIPRYLEIQDWPGCQIKGARVTTIWTQRYNLSKKIAEACYIDRVAETLEELIEDVDAILLARDDAENHIQFLELILKTSKPVYVDKPIALSLKTLNLIYEMQQYKGQIFSCSALKYADELKISAENREKIGSIHHISAVTAKSWDKYAIHLIDPLLNLLDAEDKPITFISDKAKDVMKSDGAARSLFIKWQSGVMTTLSSLGAIESGITFHIYGSKGVYRMDFVDSFSAFRAALQDFVDGIIHRDERTSYIDLSRAIRIIEQGRL